MKIDVNTPASCSSQQRSRWLMMLPGSATFLVFTLSLDVVLPDPPFLADDVTVLCFQAAVSTSCLANLEMGVELVQLVGECRVAIDHRSVAATL